MVAGSTHYSLLGIDAGADFQAIKKAYYRRAKECHPDRFGGDRVKEEEFKRVVAAFNVLSDPLARRRYDARLDQAGAAADSADYQPDYDLPEDRDSILDTYADDALEELIVGNNIPLNSSLATLMMDLERTERFCLFREAKTAYYHQDYFKAVHLYTMYLKQSPNNILARYFLAKSFQHLRKWRLAERELGRAIRIGEKRVPPLRLSRMRKELERFRERHGGLLAKVRNALAPAPPYNPNDDPERQMSRQVGRTINRLAAKQARERKRLN
ncbi:MAG: J domain-containing protein [Lentisphaeria bacterium]|nr:J domain-containing protein [Lentisphaeria bacterium]